MGVGGKVSQRRDVALSAAEGLGDLANESHSRSKEPLAQVGDRMDGRNL